MTPAAFWSWIWTLNEHQGIQHSPASGYRRKPSPASLARSCGLSPCTFGLQETRGMYPTVSQAQTMARVLGVDFKELERRARLRGERPRDDIQTCLSCPLPDCEAGELGCPLMRF